MPLEPLESLQRLASLVKICEEAQPAPVRSHWPIAALFAATLAIVSVLLFTGPRSTEIVMDLHVEQLSFALAQRQVLSKSLRLASLGVTGIGQVSLPRTQNAAAQTLLSPRDFDSNLLLTVLPTGDLSLSELMLPSLSKVVIEKSAAPLQYRLTVAAANVGYAADVTGPVNLGAVAGEERPLMFLSPKSIGFTPQGSQVDLDLTFLTLPQKISPVPLAVQDVSVLHIEERRGIQGLPPRRVSTIASGTLYFEDLNGKKLGLRPGDLIELVGSEGEFESLQLKDDITVRFRGRVRGIFSGPADIRRSLMPTWLEWLKARQGLTLLWGSALYVFGLAAGVLRWFKGSA